MQTRATAYAVHEAVGRGGMAAVHLATMNGPAGVRRVAIKRLADDQAVDEQARARLVAEGRLVFQLTHANICQVLDLAAGDEGTFLVMEYVEGLDLRRLVERTGRLEIAHALYVAREVARALDYAHRRRDADGQPLGLVHGDVTPANVLLSCEGEVKLADFGIARALAAHAPGQQLIGGTPGYIAPETRGHGPGQRGDIYSLGVTLYVALSGLTPQRSDFAPAALRSARPETSAELAAVIARATAADPAARFASAAQLEESLALELARRYSAFTPSSLARVVTQARGPDRPAADDDATTRVLLTSITAASGSLASAGAAPATVATSRDLPSYRTDEGRPPGTRTLPPPAGTRVGRPRRRVAIALGAIAVAGTAVALAIALSRAPREAPAQAAAATPPPPAALAPAPAPVPAAPAPDAAPPEAAPPAPAVPRPRRPAHAPRAATRPAGEGSLTVTAGTWGAVYVDGRQVAAQTPLYRYRLPAGAHRVKLFHPGRGTYSDSRSVTVAPDRDATVTFP